MADFLDGLLQGSPVGFGLAALERIAKAAGTGKAKDLLPNPQERSNTDSLSGPSYDLKQMALHPYRALTQVGNEVSGVAQSAVDAPGNVLKAILPQSMAGAAEKIGAIPGLGTPFASEAVAKILKPTEVKPTDKSPTVWQRAFTILNNAPLIAGIPEAAKNAFLKSQKDSDPSSIESTYVKPTGNAALEVLHSILPLREAGELLRGTKVQPDGTETPLTPEEVTHAAVIGGLKAYGAKAALDMVLPKDLAYDEAATKKQILDKTKSWGEIKAGITQGKDMTAGSSAVGLIKKGVDEVTNAASAIGPVDQIITSNIRRAKQSAQILQKTTSPNAPVSINSDFNAWHLGPLEGEVSEDIRPQIKALTADTPGISPKGKSSISTEPAESFNTYRKRTLGALNDQLEQWESNPNRTLVVQHSKNLELLQSWIDNSAPKDLSVDPDTFDAHTSGAPGSIYQLSRDNTTGLPKLEDVTQAPPQGDALLLMRHGSTSFDSTLPGGEPTIGKTHGVEDTVQFPGSSEPTSLNNTLQLTPDVTVKIPGSEPTQDLNTPTQNTSPTLKLGTAPNGRPAYLQEDGAPVMYADADAGTNPKISGADVGPPTNPLADPGFAKLPQEVQDHLYDSEVLKSPITQKLVSEAIFAPKVQEFLKTYNPLNKATSSVHEAIVSAIADPNYQSKYLTELSDTYGMSIPDIKTTLSKSVDHTAEVGGQTLKTFSDAVQNLNDSLVQKAQNGSVAERIEAQRLLKNLTSAKQGAASTQWQKMARLWGRIENLRRANIVTAAAVAMGNTAAQGVGFGATIADGFNTSIANSLRQGLGMTKDLLTGEDIRPFNATKQLADVTEVFSALYRHMPFTKQLGDAAQSAGIDLAFHPIDTILNGAPITKDRTLGGVLFEADAGLFGHTVGNMVSLLQEGHEAMQQGGGALQKAGWNALWNSSGANFETLIKALPFEKLQTASASVLTKSIGRNMLSAGEVTADILNTFNRAQETWFRRTLFDARFRANLKHIDMSFEDASDHLLNRSYETDPTTGMEVVKKIPQGLRESLADAEMHALKNTFALTPKGGMLGGILEGMNKLNRDVFPVTAVTVTFPRFMANNLIWQLDHSPTQFFDLLKPEARTALLDASDSAHLGNETNMRRVGAAATGAMLSGMGYLMAAGHSVGGYIQGPKPWLLWNGDKDEQGNPKYLNTSFMQPFTAYQWFGSMMHSLANNRPSGLTIDDSVQALANNTLSDIPIANLADTLRNANSDNPETTYEALAKYPGQYFGSWMQSFKGIHDELNALAQWSPGMDRTRDRVKPDLETQPIAGPILRGLAPTALPPKFDIFHNRWDYEENPSLAITRFESHSMTPFQEWLNRINVPEGSVIPNYKSPDANNQLRMIAGQILAKPENQQQILVGAFSSGQIPQPIVPFLQDALSKSNGTIDGFAKAMMARSASASDFTQLSGPDGTTIPYATFMEQLSKYSIDKIRGTLHKATEAQFQVLEQQRISQGLKPLGAIAAANRLDEGFSVFEGPLLHMIHDNPNLVLKPPVSQESPQ